MRFVVAFQTASKTVVDQGYTGIQPVQAAEGHGIQEDTQIVLDALPIHVTRITVDGEQARRIEGLLGTNDSGVGTYA